MVSKPCSIAAAKAFSLDELRVPCSPSAEAWKRISVLVQFSSPREINIAAAKP